jgi:hypothetical protein
MNVNPNIPISQFPVETPRAVQSGTPQQTARPVEAPHHTEASARKTSSKEHARHDAGRQNDERAADNEGAPDQDRLKNVGGLVDIFA